MSKIELSSVPTKRKEYLNAIGKLLVSKHGKKKAYKVKAIQQACKKSKYTKDFGVANFPWILCVFTDEVEFNNYYDNIDMAVDYSKMRKRMLKGITYDKILDSKRSNVKGTIDINSTDVSNLIDPNVIG